MCFDGNQQAVGVGTTALFLPRRHENGAYVNGHVGQFLIHELGWIGAAFAD